MDIPESLKAHRKKRGLTQDEAAEIAGVSKTAYVSYEHNKRVPLLVCCINLATHYGITIDELLTGKRGASGGPTISDRERRLLELWRRLDEGEKIDILLVLAGVASKDVPQGVGGSKGAVLETKRQTARRDPPHHEGDEREQ